MAKVDVLISGAGPVGLTMANELVRHGISVRIVDKSAERTDKSKALVLWSRTLELFDHAGYVEPFLAAGMQAHGAQMSNGKDVIARISLDDIESPYPYALMIPQSDTERVLEERLAKQGVKVERTVALESFKEQGNGVEAVLRKASGESETLTADWLIGCDGAHSIVRHGLGFTFDGTTQPSDWYLADGHFSGLEPQDRLHIFWHKDGILAFFPITEGRWRVIADLGPAEGDAHCPDPTLQEIQALITLRGTDGIVIKDAYWLAAFRINERKVSQYGRGRAFLAGDAAHIHSPAGGQGMNTGMQDAFNLAWKLSLVIGGVCKPVAARQLLRRAQRGRRHGTAQRRPLDGCRHHPQPDRPGPAQHRGEVRAGLSATRAPRGQPAGRTRYRLSQEPFDGGGRASSERAPSPARVGRIAFRPIRARRVSPPSARPMSSPRWRQNFPSWSRRHPRPAGPTHGTSALCAPTVMSALPVPRRTRRGRRLTSRTWRGRTAELLGPGVVEVLRPIAQ